ncbi:MAG TPA: prephenate dehydrogenase/arogenate dehydrogenase family protein [Methanomicrobiales archaeon]|jgi:prephenate dehydrogenase|nr:prephenate dehydrogenase/arogenate dehydrogenase family protein [Methanomicrobiales archaeon]
MIAGIIGGTGKMGRLFGSVLERHGFEVRVSGRRTELTNRQLAEESDLIMVSVPIRSTAGVISEIAPLLGKEQLLCDLTSLKAVPVEAMLRSEAQVLGMHPLFGPTVPSLRNQTVILTPARCSTPIASRVPEILRAEGADLVIMNPDAHDRLMAIIQGLTHFGNLCMADAIRRSGTDLAIALGATSPVYRIQMALIGRLLSQDPALYGDILQLNPHVPGVLAAFGAAAADLRERVEGGDLSSFVEFFGRNAEMYRPYLDQAAAETDALIAYLTEKK